MLANAELAPKPSVEIHMSDQRCTILAATLIGSDAIAGATPPIRRGRRAAGAA